MINIYPFNLDFLTDENGEPAFAVFPYIMNGVPVKEISCLIYSQSSKNMLYFDGIPGLEHERRAFLKQIHSREIMEIDSSNLCRGMEADGIITQDKDVILSVTVGDCLPVYLYDCESRVFALLHSGWKGTGIALDAVNAIKNKRGAAGESIAAVLGPCIRSCCYRVDEERAKTFEAGLIHETGGSDGEYPLGPVIQKRKDGYFIDLQAANARLLAGAGVRNIAVCENCTFTDTRLGSFRREGKDYKRMIAMTGFFTGKLNQ